MRRTKNGAYEYTTIFVDDIIDFRNETEKILGFGYLKKFCTLKGSSYIVKDMLFNSLIPGIKIITYLCKPTFLTVFLP